MQLFDEGGVGEVTHFPILELLEGETPADRLQHERITELSLIYYAFSPG
jgi:hypothetical protein